jgi:hypothetical protein
MRGLPECSATLAPSVLSPSREIGDSTIDPMHGGCDRPDRSTRCRSLGTIGSAAASKWASPGAESDAWLPERFSGYIPIGSWATASARCGRPVRIGRLQTGASAGCCAYLVQIASGGVEPLECRTKLAGQLAFGQKKRVGGPSIDQCVRSGARRSPFRPKERQRVAGLGGRSCHAWGRWSNPRFLVKGEPKHAAAEHGLDGGIRDFP